MSEIQYKDSEGKDCTLDWLVRHEPEWAVNIIGWYASKLGAVEQERDDAQRKLKNYEPASHYNGKSIEEYARENAALALRLGHFQSAIDRVVALCKSAEFLNDSYTVAQISRALCSGHSFQRFVEYDLCYICKLPESHHHSCRICQEVVGGECWCAPAVEERGTDEAPAHPVHLFGGWHEEQK